MLCGACTLASSTLLARGLFDSQLGQYWHSHGDGNRYVEKIYCHVRLCAYAGVPIFEEREKQNCLALLGFASMLWCTEALPLYVTSMLVPLLAVVLR